MPAKNRDPFDLIMLLRLPLPRWTMTVEPPPHQREDRRQRPTTRRLTAVSMYHSSASDGTAGSSGVRRCWKKLSQKCGVVKAIDRSAVAAAQSTPLGGENSLHRDSGGEKPGGLRPV